LDPSQGIHPELCGNVFFYLKSLRPFDNICDAEWNTDARERDACCWKEICCPNGTAIRPGLAVMVQLDVRVRDGIPQLFGKRVRLPNFIPWLKRYTQCARGAHDDTGKPI